MATYTITVPVRVLVSIEVQAESPEDARELIHDEDTQVALAVALENIATAMSAFEVVEAADTRQLTITEGTA